MYAPATLIFTRFLEAKPVPLDRVSAVELLATTALLELASWDLHEFGRAPRSSWLWQDEKELLASFSTELAHRREELEPKIEMAKELVQLARTRRLDHGAVRTVVVWTHALSLAHSVARAGRAGNESLAQLALHVRPGNPFAVVPLDAFETWCSDWPDDVVLAHHVVEGELDGAELETLLVLLGDRAKEHGSANPEDLASLVAMARAL